MNPSDSASSTSSPSSESSSPSRANPNRDLFTGAARFYSKFRTPYPPELLETIIGEMALDKTRRILDLGCGPGSLSIPLATAADKVIAVDPNKEMLAEARGRAAEAGQTNIEWIEQGAEDFVATDHSPAEEFAGAVFGNSFHWMNQPAVLLGLDGLIQENGVVCIASGGGLGSNRSNQVQPAQWHQVLGELVTKYVGPNRLTSDVASKESQQIEQACSESAFSDSRRMTFAKTLKWTFEDLIGYLNSTSYAKPSAFNGKQRHFEAELRNELTTFMENDQLTYATEFQLIVAKRPN